MKLSISGTISPDATTLDTGEPAGIELGQPYWDWDTTDPVWSKWRMCAAFYNTQWAIIPRDFTEDPGYSGFCRDFGDLSYIAPANIGMWIVTGTEYLTIFTPMSPATGDATVDEVPDTFPDFEFDQEINEPVLSIINNIEAGLINNYAYGDAPALISLIDADSAPAQVGLIGLVIGKPINPLFVSLSNGAALACWGEPNQNVFMYDIFISLEYNGLYELFEMTNNNRIVLTELPVGETFYLKVSARYKNGLSSELVQFKIGKFRKLSHLFNVLAIRGTEISQGYVISPMDRKTGLTVSFQCLYGTTF
jgi:hypothetical protein